VLGRGDEGLDRRAADLAARLPEALVGTDRLQPPVTWYPRGKEAFSSIDAGRWRLRGENPMRRLQETSREGLAWGGR
jgi:hypothetical protein